MSAWYRTEMVTVCTRLAGNHRAGVLLYVIVQRLKYAKATLPGEDGNWSANQRTEWCKAADLSVSQADRMLGKLDKDGLIERRHGRWSGKPHVLHVQLTERTRRALKVSTTFLALDTLLGGGTSDAPEIKRLRKLWQAWPGTILDEAPEKAGAIALWYEQLDDRKYTTENLKPYALCWLTEILKADPEIVDINAEDLPQQLHYAIHHKLDPETELWAA